ncbi:hypothetical protein F2Q69_00003225 [Brassica cretica]|uniref:Uncharacterized protein n=1 Tax=Brassica cretica TaxID=69181 RepID=A0A8S9NY01_BRACR|nr:hypothetical protein F2Q69_00003225 [Brassica cretica]
MANPWFTDGNSASALSPLLLTTGDNRILIPPDPPDPDPDNPLSLTRFPPLNSPGSKTPKTSQRQSRQTLSSDPSRLNSTSTTLTFGSIQPIHQTMLLTLPFKLVSPPSPSDHPKKRPRQTSPSSTQQFSSFTAQLKFFSSSPALPALDPPVAKPFETLLLAQTLFLF